MDGCALGSSSPAEGVHNEQELRRAAAHLSAAMPGFEIQRYFVDFEGIWEVDVGSSV
jgi:hypothetical protein